MTDDTRLDVATLQHLIKWHEEESREFEPDRDAFLSHEASIEHLRELIAAAESAPPRLSDWVRACEGTALGEPHWSAERWDDYGQMVAWFSPDLVVVMGVDGDAAPMSARVGSDPRGDDGTEHYSPAELRAALEALAKGTA